MPKYNQMDINDLYSELEPQRWTKLSPINKLSLMNAIMVKEKDSLIKPWKTPSPIFDANVDLSGFKDFRTSLIFKPFTLKSIDGDYSPTLKLISLNAKNMNDEFGGRNSYYVLMHELTHSFQDFVISNLSQNPSVSNYANTLSSYRDSTNVKLDFLDFNYKQNGLANLHIGHIPSENMLVENLSNMFYVLNITEREAYSNQENFGDSFVDVFNKTHKFQLLHIQECNPINDFNDRYKCQKSEDEIYKIIDSCIDKLRKQEQPLPTDDLTANVMYDMSCMALLMEHPKQEAFYRKCLEEKDSVLERYGFVPSGEKTRYGNYIIKKDIDDGTYWKYYTDIEKFKNLSPQQQINNPELILSVAYNNIDNVNIKDCIYDFSALKMYCQIEGDKICKGDEDFKNKLCELFGDDLFQCPIDKYIEETDGGYVMKDLSHNLDVQEYDDDFSL